MNLKLFLLSLLVFSIWHVNCSFAEVRAMWITRFQMDSPQKIDQFVEKAKENGFNTIFVQVLGRGIAFYNSKILPQRDPKFDALSYAIQKSHANGIKIHAWLNACYVWSNPIGPESSLHVVNRYPSWLLYDGFSKYLNPSIPSVHNYLCDVYSEVAKNYPVDGIHLDYIRYPGPYSGFDYASRRRFSNSFWLDPIFLIDHPKLVIDYYGLTGYRKLMAKWNDYRSEQVSQLVKSIYFSIKSANPSIEVSAAVFADPLVAKKEKGQDWVNWIEAGIVDFVVPMAYTDKTGKMKKLVSNMAKFNFKKKPIVGLGAFMIQSRDLIHQIHVFRKINFNRKSFAGFCLFSYDSIAQKPWYLEKIKKYAF